MIYRELGRTGIRVSEIGLGCEHLQDKPLALIREVVGVALEHGVNILDVFMGEPQVRTDIGKALEGKRDRVILQGHIGAIWKDGQYARSREVETCARFVEDFMARMQTNYIDIGMLHFIDTQTELEKVLANGLIDYAVSLKEKGVIRAVGASSHDPIAAQKLVETGKIDVLMFSINPAFDCLPPDVDIDNLFNAERYAAQDFAIAPERARLYETCAAMGTGITIMKTLGGGRLLSASDSPLGMAMTVPQLIHYGLTRPAVASALIGCQTIAEVEAAVAYETATDAERNYAAALAGAPRFAMTGRCMYCNHCLPCPSHIDIAQVNKYLDLALLPGGAPDTVRAHYAALERNASDCVACRACEARCPFGVPVVERMEKAKAVFG